MKSLKTISEIEEAIDKKRKEMVLNKFTFSNNYNDNFENLEPKLNRNSQYQSSFHSKSMGSPKRSLTIIKEKVHVPNGITSRSPNSLSLRKQTSSREIHKSKEPLKSFNKKNNLSNSEISLSSSSDEENHILIHKSPKTLNSQSIILSSKNLQTLSKNDISLSNTNNSYKNSYNNSFNNSNNEREINLNSSQSQKKNSSTFKQSIGNFHPGDLIFLKNGQEVYYISQSENMFIVINNDLIQWIDKNEIII